MLSTLTFLLANILYLYSFILVVRIVIEMIISFAPDWRPNRYLSMLFEILFLITDPPIKLFRKIIPPVRLGAVQLDFSVMVLLFVIMLLIQVLSRV